MSNWRYYNPNPADLKVGDCTVRAICAVTGLDWSSVHWMLCRTARDMADMPSANRVVSEVLRRLGFSRAELIDQCPNCYTVADFAEDHPDGTFVLFPQEHAVAVIDGKYWDAWDSGDTVPTYYFRRF